MPLRALSSYTLSLGRGFIKFMCRRSVGFFSRAFLGFLMKESKKRRRKLPGKLIAEGREGGVLIPFPRKLFFSNPSSNPTIPACLAQIEIPFPFFYCFFFHESQSQCTKSHFPASKKGKSQLPFYPFTTLIAKSRSQPVNLPGAQPLMNPLPRTFTTSPYWGVLLHNKL